MSMTDMEDRSDFLPTLFDKEKIFSLEIGEDMEAESGAWKVLRYKKDFVVILNLPTNIKIVAQKSLPSAEKVIEFLEDAFQTGKFKVD